MTPEIFTQALRRSVEVRDSHPDTSYAINLCGLGEPLLHRQAPEFAAQVRAAGFRCGMASNASLLDERKGRALLDAGLNSIDINASETDGDYQEVYRLPFGRTLDNIVRFAEMARDRCEVRIVLVDYRHDADHLKRMRAFWEERGIDRFLTYDLINRGGALFVDHMQYERYAETRDAHDRFTAAGVPPLCVAPFLSLFVGYDGLYYLCCSDWKKEAALGSVFDESFDSVIAQKVDHLLTREPICKTCNLDPINLLTEELRAAAAGEVTHEAAEALYQNMVSDSADMHEVLSRQIGADTRKLQRRRIPVQAL
jgi:MoaA/NifB/PqqE/SkfB family radical SAM enzyme